MALALFSKGHEEYSQTLLVLCLGRSYKSQSSWKEVGSLCEMGVCMAGTEATEK